MFLRYGEIKAGKICSKRQTGNNGTLLPGEGMAAIHVRTCLKQTGMAHENGLDESVRVKVTKPVWSIVRRLSL
jgi:hypothetical protein